MSMSPFTFGQRLGIFLTVEASILSWVSASFILCFALYRQLRNLLYTWKRKDILRPSDATSSGLFLNLMVADLIQASGNIPSIEWIKNRAVTDGRLCTMQAALKQIGIVGVSLTSLAIAFHTFTILVLRHRIPRHVPKYIIVGIWCLTALIIGTGNAVHRHEVYYGDTGYWCWIVTKYKTAQIMTEYFWVWLSGFFMIVLYTIMFVVIRGWFVIDHGMHWYNKPRRGTLVAESEDDKKIKSIANSMLYYPAVYIFCVFPNTLVRWLSFSDTELPPYQAILFANTIYALSGFFNLVLFFLTRPKVVVGPVLPKDVLQFRHDSTWHSSQKGGLSEYNYGALDMEQYSRPDLILEPKSPSRAVNRTRSSYELQGVVASSSSSSSSLPTRNTHYRTAPSFMQVEEVDIS